MPYIFIKNAIILKIIHNIFNLHDTEVVRRMLTTIKDVIFISGGMQTLITMKNDTIVSVIICYDFYHNDFDMVFVL
jgi:putative NIF3 family GTP cyclohydrolase 1 type 2